MPKRKKSRPRKSNTISFYRVIIFSCVILVVGSLLINLGEIFVSRTSKVLGVSTFLALRGGSPQSQGNPGGPRENSRSENSGKSDVLERPSPTQKGNEKGKEKSSGDSVSAEEEINIATDGGGFNVNQHLGARTHFPLTIDPVTNTLYVTTPAGTKAVTVLPDKAVENMLTKGILSKIGGGIASSSGNLGGATLSGSITGEEPVGTGSADINLEEQNGSLVYKIHGSVKQKFLGIIPVDLERDVTVSAESGEVESIQESLSTQIIDLFSF